MSTSYKMETAYNLITSKLKEYEVSYSKKEHHMWVDVFKTKGILPYSTEENKYYFTPFEIQEIFNIKNYLIQEKIKDSPSDINKAISIYEEYKKASKMPSSLEGFYRSLYNLRFSRNKNNTIEVLDGDKKPSIWTNALKLFLIGLLIFLVAGSCGRLISYTDTGLKADFYNNTEMEVDETSNHSISDGFLIGGEEYVIHSYQTSDDYLARVQNITTREFEDPVSIKDTVSTDHPLIVYQMVHWYEEEMDDEVQSLEVDGDEYLINDIKYTPVYESTQLNSVETEGEKEYTVNDYSNPLITQKGQKNVLSEKDIDVSEINIDDVEYFPEHQAAVITFTLPDYEGFYMLETTHEEDVTLYRFTND